MNNTTPDHQQPKGDLPAFPIPPTFNSEGEICSEKWAEGGLTKREYFAGRAMQAMLSDVGVSRWLQEDPRYDGNNFKDVVAINAVEFSDALLSHLSNTKQ